MATTIPYVRYNVTTDFRLGLDTRKSVLTSLAGALVTLENAHVNQGGEVEKRQKFAADAVAFHAGTYGLEYTSEGLVTFYSGESAPDANPTGVTARRLYHPAELYDGTVAALDSILYSTNYGGYAFVIAHFADGKQFMYYGPPTLPAVVDTGGGITAVLAIPLVEQSWEGVVLAGRATLALLGTDLERAIEREADGWLVTPNSGADGTDIVLSPSGVTYSPLIDFESTDGLIGEWLNTAADLDGSPGAQAYAAAQMTAMTAGTITVTAPAESDGSGSHTLANAVAYAGSIALTVTAIVAAINLRTVSTGYSAKVDDLATDTFIVFAPLEWGAFAFNLTVSWSDAGTTFAGGTYADALRVVQVKTVKGTRKPDVWSNGATVRAYTNNCIVVMGGTPPYATYFWSEPYSGSGNGIYITDRTIACPTFEAFVPKNQTISGLFRLSVTDSAPNTATLDVWVTLHCGNDIF